MRSTVPTWPKSTPTAIQTTWHKIFKVSPVSWKGSHHQLLRKLRLCRLSKVLLHLSLNNSVKWWHLPPCYNNNRDRLFHPWLSSSQLSHHTLTPSSSLCNRLRLPTQTSYWPRCRHYSHKHSPRCRPSHSSSNQLLSNQWHLLKYSSHKLCSNSTSRIPPSWPKCKQWRRHLSQPPNSTNSSKLPFSNNNLSLSS